MIPQAILELNGLLNVNGNRNRQDEKAVEAVAPKEFVHPILTKKDFEKTMDNYRKAVEQYNQKVVAANKEIRAHNATVAVYRQEKPLNNEQQAQLIQFYKSISPLGVWQRNERIQAFNDKAGMIAEMDKIQTVKYPTEQIFEAILWHYNMQLYKRKDVRMKLEVYVPGKMPHVDLHSGWIATAKKEGVVRLPISKDTFRRHRERLFEAGILQDYIFQGSSRPVKMRINPDILVVTDNFSSKKRGAGNQHVTQGGAAECEHNKVSNRTFINKVQIKANVKEHSQERSSLPLTSPDFSSIRNTQEQDVKKNDAPPAEKMSLSGFLRRKIEDPEDLAAELADHQHDQYTPIRLELLQKEAYSGTLDRDEFKELVLQDFFKTAAKLWKDKTPFMGSWMKAYMTWMNEKFVTPSGLSSNKHVIVEWLPEIRYRLTAVGRYLKKHPEFNLLFPGDYFDVTRTTAKEGGFEYTKKAWKKHQAYLQEKENSKKKASATAKARKRRLSDRQKVDQAVNGYLRGKFDLQELLAKVQHIGNRELTDQLPEIIKKANLKFQLKNL